MQTKSSTFDSLEDSGERRFALIDTPLAKALISKLPTDLRARVGRKEEELVAIGKTITGRQVAWMIYEYFRTDAHTQHFSSLQDLMSLAWRGDSPAQMEQFLQNWDYIVRSLDQRLDHIDVQSCFFEKWQNSRILSADVMWCKRARARGPGDPEFTLEFMRRSMEIHIKDSHALKNTADSKAQFGHQKRENNLPMTTFRLRRGCPKARGRERARKRWWFVFRQTQSRRSRSRSQCDAGPVFRGHLLVLQRTHSWSVKAMQAWHRMQEAP